MVDLTARGSGSVVALTEVEYLGWSRLSVAERHKFTDRLDALAVSVGSFINILRRLEWVLDLRVREVLNRW